LHKHRPHTSLQPDVARGVTRKLVARTTLLWCIVLSLAMDSCCIHIAHEWWTTWNSFDWNAML